jgi:hypothetical protein
MVRLSRHHKVGPWGVFTMAPFQKGAGGTEERATVAKGPDTSAAYSIRKSVSRIVNPAVEHSLREIAQVRDAIPPPEPGAVRGLGLARKEGPKIRMAVAFSPGASQALRTILNQAEEVLKSWDSKGDAANPAGARAVVRRLRPFGMELERNLPTTMQLLRSICRR